MRYTISVTKSLIALLVTAIIAMMVGVVVFNNIQDQNHTTFAQRESAQIARQRDALIKALQQLQAVDESNTAIEGRNVAGLLDFVISLRNQQAALLRWVKTHPGQPIPASLLEPIPVPSLTPISHPSKARGKPPPHHTVKKAKSRKLQARRRAGHRHRHHH